MAIPLDAQAVPHEATTSAARPLPAVSVTVSPIDLVERLLAIKAEVPVGPAFGLGLRGAGGCYETDTFASVRVVEVGAQAVWYAFGDFRRGVQLALDLRQAWNWSETGDSDAAAVFEPVPGFGSTPEDRRIEAEGVRTRIGLLAGLKWTGVWGGVVELQGGIGWRRSAGEARSTFDTSTHEAIAWEPRIELGLGLAR